MHLREMYRVPRSASLRLRLIAYLTRTLKEPEATYHMPNGSFPVTTKGDWDDAWHLRGHSKMYSKAKVEAYLKRIAKKEGWKVPEPSDEAAQVPVSGVHRSRPIGSQSINIGEVEQNRAATEPTLKPAYDKETVHYGPGSGGERCATCRFYMQDGKCSLVQGPIGDDMWCDLWSPVKEENRGEPDDSKHVQLAEFNSFYRLSEISLADAGTGVFQSWVPVFPSGKFQHPEYGELDFSEAELQKYLANFNDRVRKIDIAVDIDHKNEDAVGWIKRLDIKPTGMFALVEWNRHGAELVADKRYRYISPQFGEYIDEETGQAYQNVLVALTITNFPFLKKMQAIALSERERGALERIARLLSSPRWQRIAQRDKRSKVRLAAWLENSVPIERQRLTEGLAILRDLRAQEETMTATKKATLPQYVVKKETDMADELDELDELEEAAEAAEATADDGDGDDDDQPENGMKPKRGKRAKAAASAAADEKDEGYTQAKATERKNARTLAEMESENKTLREEMAEITRQLREQEIEKNTAKLSEPTAVKIAVKDDDGLHSLPLGFGKPVIDEYKEVAAKDAAAGRAILKVLSMIRQDGGLVALGETGRNSSPEDAENDPGALSSVTRDEKEGLPVVGGNIVKRAKAYASENKLDWKNLSERTEAMAAVIENGAGDDGVARTRKEN